MTQLEWTQSWGLEGVLGAALQGRLDGWLGSHDCSSMMCLAERLAVSDIEGKKGLTLTLCEFSSCVDIDSVISMVSGDQVQRGAPCLG